MRPLLASFSLALLTTAARAEDPTPGAPAEPSPLTFQGFVDGSLLVPLHGYAPGARGVVLGLDQVELDVIARPTADLEIRVDLHWFPARSLDGAAFDDFVEQARMDLQLGSGWFLRFGKLNAPLGIELQDPVDMYQFSYSPIFAYAQPSNLTGAFVGWASDSLELQLFATNDWDSPGTAADLSAGARAAVTAGGHVVGLTALFGPVSQDERRLLLDLDLTLALGDLTLWLELVLGRRESALGDTSSWGVTGKGNYAFCGHSLTLRATWLHDEAGLGGLPELGRENLELTLAWLFPVHEGLAGVFEVRADVYESGDPVITSALELTASF